MVQTGNFNFSQMKCVTGKNAHESEKLALDSLIQNHIRHNHRKGSGPINVYQCHECGQWHFTSKGSVTEVLKDPEVIKSMQKERKLGEWENEWR